MINENEVYLITDEKQRLFYTGYQSTDGYLVLGNNFKKFVIDSRYFYAAKKVLKKKGIEAVLGAGYGPLFDMLAGKGITTIGVDFTKITLAEAVAFKSKGFTLENIADFIKDEMIVKSESALKKIQKACTIAETALKSIIPSLKVGVKESEIAAELEYKMKMLGASGTSFETIVAFGANSAVPHHVTGSTRLEENMPVLIDFGCIYDGYCSDMTRTFYFGKPDKEFKRCYDSVLRAHINAYENITDGTDCVKADAFARDVLKADGLDKVFTHSLGHGIGVYIHEAPSLSPKGKGELKNGMVFSIEPGVYFDGKFGIRIEDSVTLENGKVKSFMKYTKKLVVIKP